MTRYLDKIKKLTNKLESYPKILKWRRIGYGASIPDCINSKESFKEMKEFVKFTGFDLDKLFAFTELLLRIIPTAKESKVVAENSTDFNGAYTFTFTVDDYVTVLKNKRPTSNPKNDTKRKKFVPQYKDVNAKYTFGIEHNPSTGLTKIWYQLYPQRNIWGCRYDEKHKDYDQFIKFIVEDLIRYYLDEHVEIAVTDSLDEAPTTFEDEL